MADVTLGKKLKPDRHLVDDTYANGGELTLKKEMLKLEFSLSLVAVIQVAPARPLHNAKWAKARSARVS